MFSNQSFIIIIIIVLLQLREKRISKISLMILPIVMLLITISLVQSVIFTSLLNFIYNNGIYNRFIDWDSRWIFHGSKGGQRWVNDT